MKIFQSLLLLSLIACNGGSGGGSSTPTEPTEPEAPRVARRDYVTGYFPNRFWQISGIVDSTCNGTDCNVSGKFVQHITENSLREVNFRGVLFYDETIQRYSGNIDLATGQVLGMVFGNGQPISINNFSKCLVFANKSTSDLLYNIMISGKTIVTDNSPSFFIDPSYGVDISDISCTN
jgi:hypothetical protein